MDGADDGFIRRSALCGSRNRNAQQHRHGEIYLEDDETVAFIVKKPISVQADPLPEYKVAVSSSVSEVEADSDKQAFYYDGDAFEDV